MRSLQSRVVAVVAGLVSVLATAAFADPAADLMASMNKLSTLKYYKVRQSLHFDLSPEMQQQMEMAKSMGMDMGAMMPKGATTEYAPGLRRTTAPQTLPSRKGMGMPQMVQANIISVAKTGAGATPVVATYTDCKVCEENQDANVRDSLERQAAMSATSVAREVVNAVAGGPAGIAAAIVNHAVNNPATQAAMAHRASEMAKDAISLNRWKCRDVAVQAEPQRAPDKLPFQGVKYVGEQTVNGEQAKAYQFTVTDPESGKTYPVTFYTATETGLPMKMEFKVDMGQEMGGSGSIAMEYYDIDVPNQIDVPDCLK